MEVILDILIKIFIVAISITTSIYLINLYVSHQRKMNDLAVVNDFLNNIEELKQLPKGNFLSLSFTLYSNITFSNLTNLIYCCNKTFNPNCTIVNYLQLSKGNYKVTICYGKGLCEIKNNTLIIDD